MEKVYKQLNKSRTPVLDKILHDKCISRGEAMKEMGFSRSFYYSKMTDDDCWELVDRHKYDWTFDPDKLLSAIENSGMTQKAVADKLKIHFVTLNVFLKGRQRPTRMTGHYFIIESFCKKWFCF